MVRLVERLPEGPLDIIGDVHGEIDALRALLGRLGADLATGSVARPLVFVGDLVDRGPDSVAVVDLVSDLVRAGRAHVALGNHELNLLRGLSKEGNGWIRGDGSDTAQLPGRSVVFPSRLASASERARIEGFFRTLPLVLERDDLRVVHACYDARSVASLPDEGDVAGLSHAWAARLSRELEAQGVSARAKEERAAFAGLKVRAVAPDRHLAAVAKEDAVLQVGNPVKVLTSGREVEVEPGRHYFTGGKWRFVERDRWWLREADRATVVGHYWRRRGGEVPDKPDPWDDVPTFAWSNGVFCVDYSVGRRYAERALGRTAGFDVGLAALRWPDRVLVFDDRPEALPTT